MRSLLLVPVVALASCAANTAASHPQAVQGRTGMLSGVYEPPKNPSHQASYDRLRKAKIAEKYTEGLSAIRLPKPLVLKFAGCDGTVNAWYEAADATITFCYEYVDDLWKTSLAAADRGVAPEAAWEGALVFVLLHESGHAVFDVLKVPVLGREEDAADQFAAFLLLRQGEEEARRVLRGAAWMYLHDSKGRMPDESDFADVHGLDAQRFYNVLCMAYGSNPAGFSGMIEKGYLPKERAEGCSDEFRQVGFAVKELIDPNIDVGLAARNRAARKERMQVDRNAAAPQSK
jgi:Putative metallopeptidase